MDHPTNILASPPVPQIGQVPDWLGPYLPPPWVWWLAAALTLATGWWLLRRARRAISAWTSGRPSEDILTIVAASIATGVSAQGMWRFSGDVLGFDGPLRLLLFAFIEVAMVTSAVRAQRNMRESAKRAKDNVLVRPSAGVDGMAVWALTGLSAVLSSMDARSIPELVFRLAAPLVAAWLWERGMAIERHRITGRHRINWRLTPERVLVRLGLAEANDRTASEVDAQRRITRVALAVMKVRDLHEMGASDRKQRNARVQLRAALAKAVEYARLASDEGLQRAMLDQIGALCSSEGLAEMLAVAPWTHLDHPAVTGAAKNSREVELAAAMREWTEAINKQHDEDREVSSAIQSMAAYIAGRPLSLPAPVSAPAASEEASDVAEEPHAPSRERSSWLAPFKLRTRVEACGADTGPGDRLALTVPLTPPLTAESTPSVEDREDDGEETDERGKPTDQDNRTAEEWIRTRCRGKNGVGRRPSWNEVGAKYGFSEGWGGLRVRAVQERMQAQGYEFQSDGTVLAPRKVLTESLTTVNGASSENASVGGEA